MWQTLRDIINGAKEQPVDEVVTTAADQVGQAEEVVSGAGEAVTTAGEELTGKLSGLLDRFSG